MATAGFASLRGRGNSNVRRRIHQDGPQYRDPVRLASRSVPCVRCVRGLLCHRATVGGQPRTVRRSFLHHGAVQARAASTQAVLVAPFHRRTGQATGRRATVVVCCLVRRVACGQSGCLGRWPHEILAHGRGGPSSAPIRTQLFFGSAVVPPRSSSNGRRMGPLFEVLLGFHKLYSHALLWSARARLSRQGSGGHAHRGSG
jgi:hypothetical protein